MKDRSINQYEGVEEAVTYARVSSKSQSLDGDGLASQETRCGEFAQRNNWRVVSSFRDEISGAASDRPGLNALCQFLKKSRNRIVVIVDNTDRIARDNLVYWTIKQRVAQAGGVFACPIHDFSNDPADVMMENIKASFAQYHRQSNAAQVVQRMRARLVNGYWPFRVPVGYKVMKRKVGSKLLVRDEPAATIVQEALEGFASDVFTSAVEVAEFITSKAGFLSKQDSLPARTKLAIYMPRNLLYTGYIEYEKWQVPRTIGQHETLISLATYQRIQDKLDGRKKMAARTGIAEDFPLRGFVTCAACDTRLTSCWTRGARGQRYPYYHCKNRACDLYGKSIRREDIESSVEAILKSLQPEQSAFKVVDVMLRDA